MAGFRHSTSKVSRHRPACRPIRSRRPTTRKPSRSCSTRLAWFSGKRELCTVHTSAAVAALSTATSSARPMPDRRPGRLHVHRVFDHSAVGRPGRDRGARDPASHPPVPDRDESEVGSMGRVELRPGWRGGFEGGVALIQPGLIDAQHRRAVCASHRLHGDCHDRRTSSSMKRGRAASRPATVATPSAVNSRTNSQFQLCGWPSSTPTSKGPVPARR